MVLKILQKKEEPLLSRTMVESEITFENATPSNQEVRAMLAKNLGKEEKLLDVKGIYTVYGSKKAKILCYAYDDEEVLKKIKIEPKKATKGKKEQEEETKEPEAKKEEKPKAKQEEKKEEKSKSKEEKQ